MTSQLVVQNLSTFNVQQREVTNGSRILVDKQPKQTREFRKSRINCKRFRQ